MRIVFEQKISARIKKYSCRIALHRQNWQNWQNRAWLFVKKEKEENGRMTFLHKKSRSKVNFTSTWQGQKAQICYASLLLIDPKAKPFGTRCAPFCSKTVRWTVFLIAKTLLGFKSFAPFNIKQKKSCSMQLFFVWQGQKDLNPRHVVLEVMSN